MIQECGLLFIVIVNFLIYKSLNLGGGSASLPLFFKCLEIILQNKQVALSFLGHAVVLWMLKDNQWGKEASGRNPHP